MKISDISCSSEALGRLLKKKKKKKMKKKKMKKMMMQILKRLCEETKVYIYL